MINCRGSQTGFGHLAALLILVIIGLVGFVGWNVWDSKNNNKVADNDNNHVCGLATPNTVKNDNYKFSLDLPDTDWHLGTFYDDQIYSTKTKYSSAYIQVLTTKELVVPCGHGRTEKMTVTQGVYGLKVTAKDIKQYIIEAVELSMPPTYKVTSSTNLKINGLEADKKIYSYRDTTHMPEDWELEVYAIQTDKHFFYLTYRHHPGDNGDANQFEQIAKSFKLTST